MIMTSAAGADLLHYLSGDVGFSDEGQYFCRAQRNGVVVEGPESAGYLSVLGEALISLSQVCGHFFCFSFSLLC